MEEKGKDVIIRGDKELALYDQETNFAVAVRQRELLENYIKERMKPDRHFYTVGEGQKPSLTKEGAELICLPHALKGRYHWLSGPETPPLDDTPYQITIKCELEAFGKFAGEGIGSASSMVTRKTGERVQRQKDPGLRHNATIKMASKSAYIAATLNSTAASEFFTQDLEDDQSGSFVKSDTKNTTEHWCKEHNTAFFMRGKMKAFAHPIGDSGVWCHEHKEAEVKEVPEVEQVDEQAQPEPQGNASEPPPVEKVKKVIGANTGAKIVIDMKDYDATAKLLWGSKWVTESIRHIKEAKYPIYSTLTETICQMPADKQAELLADLKNMIAIKG